VKSPPEVSVCLTSFNRGRHISKTLDSLLAQDFEDFELLIQDDCSTDDTADVCREYERRDSRVHFARNHINLGMPGNLNAVLARARGEFVANLHDGDIFQPGLLRKWRQALRDTKAAFAFCALEFLDGHGLSDHIEFYPFESTIERGVLVAYMLERFGSPVWGTVMARRACYEKHGYFDPRYSWISDVEMWMRLNLHYPVAYVGEPLIRLLPHEPDRPYASVNWELQRALVDMRRQIAEQYYGRDTPAMRSYLERLGRLQDKTWLFLAGACLKRRQWHKCRDACRAFRSSGRRRLRLAGLALSPLLCLSGRIHG
jgi:glycosyltransferase involved in cell wall biosynthesis